MRTAAILLALLASCPAFAKDSKPFDPSVDAATQAAAFLKGISREYEATANADAYTNDVTEYGVALESALVAMVQPAIAGQAKD